MKKWYIQKYQWLLGHPFVTKLLIFLSTYLTRLVYVVYIGLGCFLLLQWDLHALASYLLVPAMGFLLETFIRKQLNAPRPYEILHIPPLKPKNTKGNSFPSRHSFSSAIIGTACYTVYPILGYIMICITLLISLCRVLLGVHWLKDVAVGILFGLLCGYIGFYLFP